MKLMYTFLLVILVTACSKEAKKQEIAVCPEPTTLTWLTAKKAEYGSCTCLIGARQGIYQNQPVIEIYLFDPLCDGFNAVYKADGSLWFISSEAIYADYTANVKEQKIIWTCSGGDQ
ncbi:MAG TPA: hypothetical protein VK666_09985 [Chryseolinea sp.]|nr:hypothetical protein [Chryseolinea sp.]